MIIRRIQATELPEALSLVARVFMQFEAPDYSPKGVESFLGFLKNPESIDALTLYGAFENDCIIGVLATRGNSHISLFFVEPTHQKKGVGRALFLAAKAASNADFMTVNSSPYAVEIYQRLGFTPLSGEQLSDGIRFTPMKCMLRETGVKPSTECEAF